jgi:hypothetical protein
LFVCFNASAPRRDPDKRPSAAELLKHEWVKDVGSDGGFRTDSDDDDD